MLTASRPRWQTGPSGADAAALEAVELAQAAGLVLDPWQVDVLRAGLAERDDGRWAALEVALIVPRQNGKGSILEAVELAGLFLFGERLILHSAHEFKTASEAFRRVWGLIEQTPDLDRRVFRKLQNNNDMSIELKSGQRLRFVARSTGSGRGFSGDRVILDEAYKLPVQAVSALMPTLSARPNPQLWYTSSAPLPIADSDVLRSLCRRGRAGSSGRLAYTEFAVDLGADLDDRQNWYAANPALEIVRPDGSGITEEWVAEAERESMTPDEFGRERLGIVDLDPANRVRVIPADDWAACEDSTSKPLEPLSFAVDVAPDRTSSTIGVAGLRPDGRVHLEVIETRPGVSWVVPRLSAILRKAKVDTVTLTPGGAAGGLLNDLGLAGITAVPCSTVEAAQACGALFDGIMDRRYLHIGQPVLTVAVDGAEKRVSGDAWVWDRRHSSGDVTPLVAVTLAAWALHTYPVGADPVENIW